MLTYAIPGHGLDRARHAADHVTLYARRRLITPFSRTSDYAPLDRWLTARLLLNPRWWRIGGYMEPATARTIAQFAADHDLTRIGQIGFNAGHFACTALTVIPGATVVSFDLGDHRHSAPAARWLDRRFPSRHQIYWGDSAETVPAFACDTPGPGLGFQLVVVDGDHRYPGAKLDLVHVAALSAPGTYVVMDDLGRNDFADGPARAWREMIASGAIRELHRYNISRGRGYAIGQII